MPPRYLIFSVPMLHVCTVFSLMYLLSGMYSVIMLALVHVRLSVEICILAKALCIKYSSEEQPTIALQFTLLIKALWE